MSEKILLIEDESAIAESVAYSLKNEGYKVDVATDGLAGLSAFRSYRPDLIILDLMLPKLGGLDFCRIVRKESNVPIVILTARTDEIDRVVGLELGADDYVSKPFSVRELVARVKAVLRRTESTKIRQQQQATLKAGRIEMDVARRRVTVGGEQVHFPLKQFELLKVLLANKGRVLTREELFQTVWDTDATYDTGTLDVHIRWLREKIEVDPSHPRYIRTMRGIGYKLVDDGED